MGHIQFARLDVNDFIRPMCERSAQNPLQEGDQ